MSRAPKVCIDCTALVYGGGSRCPEHVQKQPYRRNGVDRSDTAARRRMKAAVFAQARYYCQIQDQGCLGRASEVDRIDNTLGYVDGNMRAACRRCHARRTSRDGNRSQGHRVSEPSNAETPYPRNVSNTREHDGEGTQTGVPQCLWIG